MSCENPNEGQACEECSTCQRINDYLETGKSPRNTTIYEYDITKLNRRDDATEIVTKMSQRFIGEGKRIYILDEIQRATPEAQASFLKVAEEPNPNVYIILCTTHPEDLLEALKSRFHKFNVRKPKTEELVDRLSYICSLEGVNYQRNALRLLATTHGGNPRETINSAEVLAELGDITKKAVEEDLGIVSGEYYEDFFEIVRGGNITLVVQLITEMSGGGDIDLRSFVRGLGEYLTNLLKIRSGVNPEMYQEEYIREKRKEIRKYSDDEIAKMLTVIIKYSNLREVAEYHLISLGYELLSVLEIEDDREVINHEDTTSTGSKFREIQKKAIEKTAVEDSSVQMASEDGIMSIFGKDAVKVDEVD